MNEKNDNELKYYALNFWANYIETGDAIMSAKDARNCGEDMKINALDLDQMKMVVRLRDLAIKELNNG